jgi:hypothetical protein
MPVMISGRREAVYTKARSGPAGPAQLGLARRLRILAPAVVIALALDAGAAGAASSVATQATSFAGTCQLSGTVRFNPFLTTTPRNGRVNASATGSCSGAVTDPDGARHSAGAQPVRLIAQSQGLESCEIGRGTGAGYLLFGEQQLHFTYRELRAGPALILRATGAQGGSALAEGNISPSANPLTILQACTTTGLQQAPIDIRLITTTTISG